MVEFRRLARATVTALLAGLVLVPSTGAASVSHVGQNGELAGVTLETATEQAFVELVNGERAAAGLAPLAVYSDLVDDARLQARAIADAGYLFHNPDLAGVTTGWSTLGENVGYGPTVDVLHQAFMDSPPHAENVLLPKFNYIGVGVVIDEADVIWVALVFMYGPAGLADVDLPDRFTPPFRDDDGSVHESAINAIAAAGITSGCGADGELFCPSRAVTRAQMATFLVKAFDLPPAATDYFDDDDGSVHEAAINALAAAGVTSGCDERVYCATERISRAHMATFLVRTAGLDPAADDYFTDDDGNAHEAAINALAAAGISGGCTADTFCPGEPVSRGQMATMLAKTLGL